MNMKFVYFHGAFGSPAENWFPHLKQALQMKNQNVIAPQFPVDNWDEMVKNGPNIPLSNQNLSNWLKTFDEFYTQNILSTDELCFIGHSLGPVFILHIVCKYQIRLKSAIFVCPFLGPLDMWEFNHANGSFYKNDFDWGELKHLIPKSYVILSDNDPYVKNEYSLEFAGKLGSQVTVLHNAGHISESSGYLILPEAERICLLQEDI
jgi:predicted alpha/beta hydrolase family esterase